MSRNMSVCTWFDVNRTSLMAEKRAGVSKTDRVSRKATTTSPRDHGKLCLYVCLCVSLCVSVSVCLCVSVSVCLGPCLCLSVS